MRDTATIKTPELTGEAIVTKEEDLEYFEAVYQKAVELVDALEKYKGDKEKGAIFRSRKEEIQMLVRSMMDVYEMNKKHKGGFER